VTTGTADHFTTPTVTGGLVLVAAGNVVEAFTGPTGLAAPALRVTPASGPKGEAVLLYGQGFAPGETVTVKYRTRLVGPVTVVLCKPTADQGGAYACGANIPTTDAGPRGAHKVVAKGETSHRKATSTFTLA
jgi:hypothetical protein